MALDPADGSLPWSKGLLRVYPEDEDAKKWEKEKDLSGIAATILAEQGRHNCAIETTPEAIAVLEGMITWQVEKMALSMAFVDWAAKRQGIHYAGTPSVPAKGPAPSELPQATPRTLAMVVNYEKGLRSITTGPCRPKKSVDPYSSIPSVTIPISKAKIAKAKKPKKPSA